MLQETLDTLQAIITRTHTCLQDLGDEDDEEEIEVEGTSEEDWQVVDTALDAIIGVAGAMGSNFGELWKLFEKTIVKLASADEARERSAAVGTIAQCIAFMGASVTPYTPRLLKVLVHRLADEDSDVKANAAFGLGLLLLHSEDSATYLPQYNTILAKLEPLLSVTDAPRLLDNAAGCVARMITAHPDKVPLAQVLPALIDILPLKEDYEENIPVYECLFKLYDLNEPTTLQLTPRLIPVFEKVLGPPENQLEPETREKLLTLVTLLFKTDPSIFQGNPNLVQMVGL